MDDESKISSKNNPEDMLAPKRRSFQQEVNKFTFMQRFLKWIAKGTKHSSISGSYCST
jgi:hypothetical protein